MEQFKDLKEGDKLYNFVYWDDYISIKRTREMRCVTIKKVSSKSCSVKGKEWRVTEKEFGIEWFLSKKECYEKALKLHEVQLVEFEENTKIYRKEVEYLKKKLQEVKPNSSQH